MAEVNWQPVLESERLLLRPLRADDWDALFAVAADREIWAIHPAHDRWQEPVFREFMADALAQGGAVAIINRTTGAIIGSSRWQGHDPADGGEVEIGWTFLAREYWGGGYNAELKQMMVAHALRFVERVVFNVGADNLRSRRAMEKIGGRLTGREHIAIRAGIPVEHVVYEIDRESFAAGPLSLP